MEIDGYICWWYAEDTCLISSDNTLGLVYSREGSELNRFIQTLS